MSHLPQPEDNKQVLDAKAALNSDARVISPRLVHLLEAVLRDRDLWIAKCAESRDVMLESVYVLQGFTEVQRKSIQSQHRLITEISAMINPDDSEPGVMKTYVTFGHGQSHQINDKTFDKDCVAVIEAEDAVEGQKIVETFFGRGYCVSYPEKSFNLDDMHHYPRGFIELN